MRGRRVLMESLVLHGVRHIFGNPGTTETPLLDSLPAYPEIDYVMTLHEGVAIAASSFYAQASGRTAVANLHVAPGLGNAIGALYGAHQGQFACPGDRGAAGHAHAACQSPAGP